MDPASTSWKDLIIDFTQTTTCHGIRYLTLPSWYWYIRKCIWIVILLCAFTAFLYLASIKLELYFKYEKIVNVEVQFRQEMKFPAVTFCNLNHFRMTALHKYGLIDALTVFNSDSFAKGNEVLPIIESSDSKYYYDGHVCELPGKVVWEETYNSITRQMCATLCSTQHNSNCTSFLYNQNDQSCTLSSYSTQWTEEHDLMICNPDNPMEYYLRRRSYDKSLDQIICTFEKGTTCPFTVEITGEKRMDEWFIIPAAGRLPNEDLTMESGDGRYLLFAETARKPSYKARYVSPFLNTTDKCLNLFYRFLGNRTTLSVYVRTTDLKEYLVSSVSWFQPSFNGKIRTDFAGTQLHEILPAGEYQVIVEAERSTSSNVTSGAVIDNLIVARCEDIDRANCMRSRSGRDYTGTNAKTVSGKKCLSWNTITLDDGSVYTKDMFPDRSLLDAKNYCRNPGGSNMETPFCHYLTPQGIIAKESCYIKHCSCIGTDMFHCSSGLCVSRQLLCDGIDHCGDKSDEKQLCGNLNHVNCHFEDPFLCGYTPEANFIAQWKWHRNDKEGINGDPLTDSRGSSIGHFLLIDNRGITVGDQALIKSPVFKADGLVSIKFFLFLRMKSTDMFAKFTVFLLSSQGRRLQDIYSISKHTLSSILGQWNAVKLCLFLPKNKYKLQFEGIVGEAYQTILAFDGVDLTLNGSDCQTSNNIINLSGKLSKPNIWRSCPAENGEVCDISQSSWNYWAAWRLMPANAIENAIFNYAESAVQSVISTKGTPYCIQSTSNDTQLGSQTWNCSLRTYDLAGDISSPDFPSNYSNNLDIIYRILLNDVTNITLNSTFMDIVKEGRKCRKDYLEIKSFQNGTESNSKEIPLCGQASWKRQVVADEVEITFHSDSAQNSKGFSLKFEAEQSPKKDYILALSNRGLQTSGVSIPYVVYFDLPLITEVNKNYCLTFLSMLAIKLEVKVITDTSEEALLRVQRMLFWQQYSVSIPRKTEPYFIRFVSDVVFYGTVEIAYFAFLKNIKMDTGSCDSGKGSNFRPGFCDFENGLCGYTEESESFSTWREASGKEVSSSVYFPMKYDEKRQGQKILFVFFESKTDVAVLKSPMITAKAEQCLTIDYLCRPQHDRSNFVIILLHKTGEKNKMTFDKIDKGCKCSDDICGWKNINATLPKGAYQLQIEASAQVKSGAWAYFAIDNINFNSGSCKDPMITYKDTESEAKPLYTAEVVSFDNGTGLIYEKSNIDIRRKNINQGTNKKILGNIGVMIKSMRNVTVKEISENTAHKSKDMILNCKWNYGDCSPNDFDSVETEFGICYTFNANKQQQKITNQTGSGSGLQLLLNIEQYEHLTGTVSEPGVKVFLHDPHEIPYVKYVGVAVPPGMNSFLNVQHEQSNRLIQPYGNCTSESDPYYPGERYTRYRCERRCQTQTLESVCGCKSDFMPGKKTVCTLSEYLSCAYPKNYVSGDINAENCTCFEACTTSHYYADLSYTRLSELNVDLYLKDKRESIENNFHYATRLRNRLEKPELDKVLIPLNNMKKYHHDFIQTLKFHVIDKGTSTVELIKEVTRLFQERALFEIKTLLFPNITLITTEYDTKVASFWQAILNPVEELIAHSHHYRNVLTYLTTKNELAKSHEWVHHIAKSTINLLIYVPSVLELYIDYKKLPYKSKYLPKKYSKEESECIQKIQDEIIPDIRNITDLVKALNISDIQNNMESLINSSNVSANASNTAAEISEQDDKNLRMLMEHFENWYINEMKPKCILEYYKFLKKLELYLETVDFLPVKNSVQDELTKGDQLEVLLSDLAKIERDSRDYLKGKIDAATLSHVFNRENVTLLKTNIENVFSTINADIFDSLDSYLKDLASLLINWYRQAQEYSLHIGDYMNDDDNHLENEFRKLHIWRKPIPDLKSPELIAYGYTEDNIDNSWPKGQDMTQFINQGIANFVVKASLDNFFTSLSSEIAELRGNLQNLMENFIVALNMLSQELSDFQDETDIDGRFVMNNFAALNIFYGELKYNDIEELPAYDIPTFFSDMGGFMGLFVGMSCITICEVLDLIIYNSVVKMTIKSSKKIRSLSQRVKRRSRNDSEYTSSALNSPNNDSTFMTTYSNNTTTKPNNFEECL